MSKSLNQFAYVAGSSTYKFGYDESIPNLPISGAPEDTNWNRWAMLHDGEDYRLYFFKEGTNDTLYQFAFNEGTESYEYGYRSIEVIKIAGIPSDASADSFAMLHDGDTYRLYLRQVGNPAKLYQFGFNEETECYEFGYDSIEVIVVDGFPLDTDWHRWGMLHDGQDYRLYAMQLGSNTEFYQSAYNEKPNQYEYGYESIPELTLVGTPEDSLLNNIGMLYDGDDYRLYLLADQA